MLNLTPDKMKEISALLALAPPATAARMLAMFERVKVQGSQALPLDAFLSALREAGTSELVSRELGVERLPSFQRIFFEPFEALLEDGPDTEMLPGSLSRSSLDQVWTLLATKLASGAVAQLQPLATNAILIGDLKTARAHATTLRAHVVSQLASSDPAVIVKLGQDPQTKATLARLIPLLTAQAAGGAILGRALGPNGELSEHGLNELSNLVGQFDAQNPDAGRELLLLTIVSLPRPHQALRILNKVSRGVDDRKLNVTEFAVIGQRAVAVAAREAIVIEAAYQTKSFDGSALAGVVDRYNHCLHGLERECILAKDGPWRRAITDIRSRVGNRLELLCQRASQMLEVALPLQKTQSPTLAWRFVPRLDHAISAQNVTMAAAHLQFVVKARLFAPLAGFGAAQQNAHKHALAHLDLVRDALLAANKLPTKSAYLGEWTSATRDVIAAIEGDDAADIFNRRFIAADVSPKVA